MTHLRPVVPADADLICRHRHEMFVEAGRSAAELAAMAEPFRLWLNGELARGSYFGFVAQCGEALVGGVGLMVIGWPPHPSHPTDDRRGYVLNLFVEPAHRGHGIARRLMQAAESEFASRSVQYAILHATQAGRPLYERTGWAPTSEMAKRPVSPSRTVPPLER